MKRRDFLKGLGGGTLGVLLEKILPKPAPEESVPKEVNHGPFDEKPSRPFWENMPINSGSASMGYSPYIVYRGPIEVVTDVKANGTAEIVISGVGTTINKYRMSDNWHKFVEKGG